MPAAREAMAGEERQGFGLAGARLQPQQAEPLGPCRPKTQRYALVVFSVTTCYWVRCADTTACANIVFSALVMSDGAVAVKKKFGEAQD